VKFQWDLFWGREDEDKGRQKNGQTCIFPKLPFLDTPTLFSRIPIKKITHSLFGAWWFLLVHIWFTPSDGP
jgi:hypothetical protein